METQTKYTIAEPDRTEQLFSLLELCKANLTRLVYHLGRVINGTGWGVVTITFKNGRLDEVSSTETEKNRE